MNEEVVRISFNLLPKKYRGVRRDWIAIILFVLFLLISALGATIFYFSNEKLKKTVKKEVDKKKIMEQEKKIKKLKEQIAVYKKQLATKVVKPEEIFELKEKISFLNKFMGTEYIRWSYFLDRIEKMAPEEMWIREIQKKEVDGVPEFIFTCWAESLKQVYVFWSNLEEDINFKDTILLSEAEKVDDKIKRKYVEFKIKFKYSPITIITFRKFDLNLEKPTGTSYQYKIIGYDVSGKKVDIPPEWLNWELVSPTKIGILRKDGLFIAENPGSGIIRVSSPDGKLIATAKITVTQ